MGCRDLGMRAFHRLLIYLCVFTGSRAAVAESPNGLTVALSPAGEFQSAPHGHGNIYAPDVHFENGRCRMWFGGQGRDGHDRIQYAESADGRTWQQRGVVLEDKSANHVNDPSVVEVDGTNFESVPEPSAEGGQSHIPSRTRENRDSPRRFGDRYYMYYTRAVTDICDDICLATSADGVTWTKRGVALKPSDAGQWDSLLVGRPSVLVENGLFRMWYDGRKDLQPGAPAKNVPISPTSSRAVGYAESRDGLHWTRPHTEPVFTHDAGGIHVVRTRGGYALLYEGGAGTQLATSPDGLTWTAKGLLVPVTGTDLDRYGHVTPFLFLHPQTGVATLYLGAARGPHWDENLIVRIDLSPTQVKRLNGE